MNNQSVIRYLRAVQELKEKYFYYIPVLDRVRFYCGKKDVKTMEIDCNLVIYVNEEYADTLEDNELNGVILHEILHFVFNHHGRYLENAYRDIVPHSIHNIAMDLEINEIVPRISYEQEIRELNWELQYGGGVAQDKIDEEIENLIDRNLKLVRLPESVFRAKEFGLPVNRSYEEYLGILHNNMPEELKALMESVMNDNKDANNSESDAKIYPFDDINIEGYSEINKELLFDLLDECDERVMESYSEDVVRTIGKRKYSWDVVFRNIISTKVQDMIAGFKYRTYLKPNRRYSSDDIIFSAYVDYSDSIRIAIIMDVSGSMGHLVNEMYATIKSIIDIQELKISCTILETTEVVVKVIHNFDFNAKYIESKDSGGTHMPAGWHYLINSDMEKNMDMIVCMTDMETNWEPLLVEKSVVLGSIPVKPADCPYTYFPVLFPQYDYSDYDDFGVIET